MGDWVYSIWKKVPRDKFLKSIKRLLKEIKIQKEEMEWNRKRFNLLNKLGKNYEILLSKVKEQTETEEVQKR